MKFKNGLEVRLDVDEVRKLGRRSECTPEVVNKIVEMIRAGGTDAACAGCVGIHRTTFYNWLRWGEEGREPYASARMAILEAQDEARVTAEIALKEIDPKAFLRYATRNDPVNRWEADTQKVEVSGAVQVDHTVIRQVLSTAELEQIEAMHLKIERAKQIVEGEIIEPA